MLRVTACRASAVCVAIFKITLQNPADWRGMVSYSCHICPGNWLPQVAVRLPFQLALKTGNVGLHGLVECLPGDALFGCHVFDSVG